MSETSPSEFSFRSTNLLLYIWDRKVPLILISFIAFVASIIISLTITPKFRSTVILFPASSASVSKALISTTGGGIQEDILGFGEEEETERILQLLYSDEIRDKLIQKFNLFEHYDIDPDSRYRYTNLYGRMRENIKFSKTEFMSVEIDVLDTDPRMAADVANEIASLLDSAMHRMQKKRALEALKIVEMEYFSLQQQISQIEDSLKKLGDLGIYDISAQAEGIQTGYLEALSKGNWKQADEFKKQMAVLARYGGTWYFLTEFLSMESSRLSMLKEKYTEARVDAEQRLPHTFIVNHGQVPEKKAYPKRSVIVIISTFSAFLFALVLLLSIETIRKSL